MCDYSDAWIVVKELINVRAVANSNTDKKDVVLKSNASFRSCITKINNILINNAEDLHIVRPMYNLLEYSHNYPMTSGSSWNYYRDEIDSADDDVSKSRSFKYKTKTKGKTPARPSRPKQSAPNPDGTQPPQQQQPPTLPSNAEFTMLLKYLRNYLRYLDFSLINCEIVLGFEMINISCIVIW